jgi:hypothetical protein
MLADLRVASTGVGTGTSLADKVALAQSRFSANDVPGTCSILSDFVSQVKAQTGKKITQAEAASLIASAQEVMTAIVLLEAKTRRARGWHCAEPKAQIVLNCSNGCLHVSQ